MDDLKITASVRQELSDQPKIFYVTSGGYAADHMFGWFAKSLNSHPEMFALLSHEGSRPKYIKERTRGERPDIFAFSEFLSDMAMTYQALGDCYSYRPHLLEPLFKQDRFKNIPTLHLFRHPLPWVKFYTKWRSTNMRMGSGSDQMGPLEWEWKEANHKFFKSLGLKSYDPEDVEVWAFYQGCLHLNNVCSEVKKSKHHRKIEDIFSNEPDFIEVAKFLSGGRISFDNYQLSTINSWKFTLFPGEHELITNYLEVLENLSDWQIDAFNSIVTDDAKNQYALMGYELSEILKNNQFRGFLSEETHFQGKLFISSTIKSGTHAIRELVTAKSGLKCKEPPVQDLKQFSYLDDTLVEFNKGEYFSWHSIMNEKLVSRLSQENVKVLFLVRNFYDIVNSWYRHVSLDVDSEIDRSIGEKGAFDIYDDPFSAIINGVLKNNFKWEGVRQLADQVGSMLHYSGKLDCFFVTYDQVVNQKKLTEQMICNFLGLNEEASPGDTEPTVKTLTSSLHHRKLNDCRVLTPSQLHIDMMSLIVDETTQKYALSGPELNLLTSLGDYRQSDLFVMNNS